MCFTSMYSVLKIFSENTRTSIYQKNVNNADFLKYNFDKIVYWNGERKCTGNESYRFISTFENGWNSCNKDFPAKITLFYNKPGLAPKCGAWKIRTRYRYLYFACSFLYSDAVTRIFYSKKQKLIKKPFWKVNKGIYMWPKPLTFYSCSRNVCFGLFIWIVAKII